MAPDHRNRQYLTIEKVVESSLCTRCGICCVICPNDSISIEGSSYPSVDWSKCTNCGLCAEFCPGLSFDFRRYYNKIHDIRESVDSPEGYFKKACLGYSNSKVIKEVGSSGGVVTQILLYLLRHKIVDAVILASDNENDPVAPIPKLVRDESEIIKAGGSKYSVIPINTILTEVRNTSKRIAYVGLGCHIHGLRRLEESIETSRQSAPQGPSPFFFSITLSSFTSKAT